MIILINRLMNQHCSHIHDPSIEICMFYDIKMKFFTFGDNFDFDPSQRKKITF